MNKILGILVVLAASVAMASASCSRPSHPWYGYHSGSWTYYPLGHRITYRCWEGYALHGHHSNICVYKDNSYIWRYPTPDCRSKLSCMLLLSYTLQKLLHFTYHASTLSFIHATTQLSQQKCTYLEN